MQEELSWIEEQIGKNRVQLIPYGVDTSYYTPDLASEEEWLIGSNGNQEAMGGWPTASSIFPLIRKHNPQARLLLLGGNSVYPPLMELAEKILPLNSRDTCRMMSSYVNCNVHPSTYFLLNLLLEQKTQH